MLHIVAILSAFLIVSISLHEFCEGYLLILEPFQVTLASLLHREPASSIDHVGCDGRVVSETLLLEHLGLRVAREARRKQLSLRLDRLELNVSR